MASALPTSLCCPGPEEAESGQSRARLPAAGRGAPSTEFAPVPAAAREERGAGLRAASGKLWEEALLGRLGLTGTPGEPWGAASLPPHTCPLSPRSGDGKEAPEATWRGRRRALRFGPAGEGGAKARRPYKAFGGESSQAKGALESLGFAAFYLGGR